MNPTVKYNPERLMTVLLAPVVVLSLVLGGIMEQSFRQAMTISGGNPKIFFGSTICVTLVALAVLSIVLPFLLPRLKAWRDGTSSDTR